MKGFSFGKRESHPGGIYGAALQFLTGRDDLERVAGRDDPALLHRYLLERPVVVPQRPSGLLDLSTSGDELYRFMEAEARRLAGDDFEPWIRENDGKLTLPVFSNHARSGRFTELIVQQTGKVFAFGCIVVPLGDILEDFEVDVVELNPLSEHSWEIAVSRRSRRA